MTFVSDPEQLLDCWHCGALPKLSSVVKNRLIVTNLLISQWAGIANRDAFLATYDTCLAIHLVLKI